MPAVLRAAWACGSGRACPRRRPIPPPTSQGSEPFQPAALQAPGRPSRSGAPLNRTRRRPRRRNRRHQMRPGGIKSTQSRGGGAGAQVRAREVVGRPLVPPPPPPMTTGPPCCNRHPPGAAAGPEAGGQGSGAGGAPPGCRARQPAADRGQGGADDALTGTGCAAVPRSAALHTRTHMHTRLSRHLNPHTPPAGPAGGPACRGGWPCRRRSAGVGARPDNNGRWAGRQAGLGHAARRLLAHCVLA